jgi:hypothetical protein
MRDNEKQEKVRESVHPHHGHLRNAAHDRNEENRRPGESDCAAGMFIPVFCIASCKEMLNPVGNYFW